MNRYPSILSAVISAVCVFLLPYLNRHGIIIDENTVTTVIVGIVAAVAFVWTAWKNHNITEAANEAQCLLAEIKADEGEEIGEEFDDYEGDDE